MPSHTRLTAFILGAAVPFALSAVQADEPAPGLIKYRANFLPRQKHMPLGGKVVGLLVSEPQPVLSAEGRSGPPDELCFACGGVSYRWVYVSVQGQAPITNLQVPVGEKGDQKQVYPALDLARLRLVGNWGVKEPYTLVEVTVNGGAGSPATDSFVATEIKVVEGTAEYPLKAVTVVTDLRKRYAAFLKDKARDLDREMGEAQKKALKDRKPTGPREQSDLMFLTWMPKTKTLVAHFRTKVSDGAYTFVQGGARPGPFPLPPPPLPPGKGGGQAPAPPPGGARQPPPPPNFRVKVGTTFGVEFGMAYEVSKEGKLLHSEVLPFQAFQVELPPPPAVGRPVPLPVPPAPRDK
jgi:hypothetical protein